ncbi:hypothetical protein RND81_08G205500 [Saponaria officinalis]|uniref:Alpha/beta hydrolase fold-3 domain-containing protein n=1 Tax=Saponaria officinalis TaxID=3572 RepID=A0AAW1J9V4_SAPOF
MSPFISFLLFSIAAASSISLSSSQPPEIDVRPFIIDYHNGTIVRDDVIPVNPVPPQSTPDPATGVVSKDVVLHSFRNLSARVFLPTLNHSSRKIPILVYFHGGAFCIGSPFSEFDHLYLNRLTSQGKVVAISINYRLFPEYTLPAAFEDAWFALEWVASQSQTLAWTEPWIASHGDFSRIFLGGDSSGATIVHNLAMRASQDSLLYGLHIYGAILATPYFLGSGRVPLDPPNYTLTPFYRVWSYVCPRCPHGVDNPAVNPVGPRSPCLRRLAVEKVLVYTAEHDPLLGRSVRYVMGIRGSRWEGILAYYEGKNFSHVFHVSDPYNSETQLMITRVGQFLRD